MASRSRQPVIFGEVLFDCFPDGRKVLGGAPFNVAWHLQAFGKDPLFISAVGDDAEGRLILEKMADWGMDTSGVQVTEQFPTGAVEISLEQGEPSYDIVDNQAYDHIDIEGIPEIEGSALLYHGSLALRHDTSREALESLAQRSGLPRFVDINLRTPWWRHDHALQLMRQADWLKLNEHELVELTGPETSPGERARQLVNDYGLNALILTRGSAGAEYIAGDTYSVAPKGGNQVVDTVGAGDAFTSVMLTGLLQDWDIDTCLQRAQTFASAVVGVRGATIDDRQFYSRIMDTW